MITRLTFLLIATFWIAMNALLWRNEFGARGGGIPVPADLVWKKILTAPDASSLSVYQNGERTGFCEFSTSVEQEMAKLDGDRPPPEGLVSRAGYQIRLNGNVSFGDFTNRMKFDGHVQFSSRRDWRELAFKISTHAAMVEIHSIATNQSASLRFTGDGASFLRVFSFADLENPAGLLRAFNQDFDGGFWSDLDMPILPQSTASLAESILWDARRDRMKIGRESVSVYRLETRVLDRPIVIYASTLGEILRVELPGGVIATLDEWNK
jgi:hypothetical protein